MRVTWINGSNSTLFVQYGPKILSMSNFTTFTQDYMCGEYYASLIYSLFILNLEMKFFALMVAILDHKICFRYKLFLTIVLLGSLLIPNLAKDFGWHDLGYIHTTLMNGFVPSSNYVYKYGRYSIFNYFFNILFEG